MFRALSAHLQEDTIVYMQHMVLSLFTRVRGGLSVHNLSENCRVTMWVWLPLLNQMNWAWGKGHWHSKSNRLICRGPQVLILMPTADRAQNFPFYLRV